MEPFAFGLIGFCIAWLLAAPAVAIAMPCSTGKGESNLASIEKVAEKTTRSPFEACQKPVATQSTGLLPWTPSQSDDQGRTTQAFLKKVSERARYYVQKNLDATQLLRACQDTSNATTEMKSERVSCLPQRKFIESDLPEFARAARANLALASDGVQMGDSMKVANTLPNKWLRVMRTPKSEPWTKLDREEEKAAASALRWYRDQIKEEVTDLFPDSNSTQLRLRGASMMTEIRKGHFRDYAQIMANVPMLQYISSAHPSPNEIKKALKQMEDNSWNEMFQINRLIDQLAENKNIEADDLWMLEYRPIVEEILRENPADCGLATSLWSTYQNAQLYESAKKIGPMMAAALFFPPAAGLAADFIGTLWIFSDDAFNYSARKQAFALGPRGEDGIYDFAALTTRLRNLQEQGMINTTTAGMPLARWLGRSSQMEEAFQNLNQLYRAPAH